MDTKNDLAASTENPIAPADVSGTENPSGQSDLAGLAAAESQRTAAQFLGGETPKRKGGRPRGRKDSYDRKTGLPVAPVVNGADSPLHGAAENPGAEVFSEPLPKDFDEETARLVVETGVEFLFDLRASIRYARIFRASGNSEYAEKYSSRPVPEKLKDLIERCGILCAKKAQLNLEDYPEVGFFGGIIGVFAFDWIQDKRAVKTILQQRSTPAAS